MPSIRFRLEQPTLTGLAERVRAEYGPTARIVATDESLVGGLGGFFAKRVIDVTVEIPDPVANPQGHSFDVPARVGLAQLLDDVEQREAVLPQAEPPVSTESIDFARVLDGLRAGVAPPPASAPAPRPEAFRAEPGARLEPVYRAEPLRQARPESDPPPPVPPVLPSLVPPAPLLPPAAGARVPPVLPGRPGDLVVIAGLGDDALDVAHALGRGLGRAHVCDGGSIEGHTRRRVEDRRGALAARAYGVQSGQTVLVAYGLGRGDPADPRIAALPGIGADQVWVVVDVSRKTVDSARWVNAVRAVADVTAMATVAGRFTTDRQAVAEIGLPEGWSDRVG
ncbi:hypothetical protein [Naasia sp. SYSU D00057]|uniref:hypothetical protein n=1 Tax=Naasia sp. SYSU D00057 TaxID=2817380 RepID=UPI001B3142B0|nr:hypothetical protein [Naasia sp. SYSU D00057]